MKTKTNITINKARAAAEAVTAVAVFVAVITIGAESWSPLKDLLKTTFTHHWLGKSALAIFVFIAVFFIRSRVPANTQSLERAVRVAIWLSILSVVLIIGYFIAHTVSS